MHALWLLILRTRLTLLFILLPPTQPLKWRVYEVLCKHACCLTYNNFVTELLGDVDEIDRLELSTTFSDFQFDITQLPDVSLEVGEDVEDKDIHFGDISFSDAGDSPSFERDNSRVSILFKIIQLVFKHIFRTLLLRLGQTLALAMCFQTFSSLNLLLQRSCLDLTGNLALVRILTYLLLF